MIIKTTKNEEKDKFDYLEQKIKELEVKYEENTKEIKK